MSLNAQQMSKTRITTTQGQQQQTHTYLYIQQQLKLEHKQLWYQNNGLNKIMVDNCYLYNIYLNIHIHAYTYVHI